MVMSYAQRQRDGKNHAEHNFFETGRITPPVQPVPDQRTSDNGWDSWQSCQHGFKIDDVAPDIGDCLVDGSSKEQHDIIVDIIREADPDVIITHDPTDYMPDHVAVAELVFRASFNASVPHYKTKVAKASKVTPIYYMDNLAGLSFVPTHFVDVSEEIDLKLEMLECHESQLKWMRDHDHIDFADFVKTCAKYRGFQSNCAYAEAFRECLVYPKVQTKRLLP